MSEAATSATYKRLRRYAKPYWGLIGIGMLVGSLLSKPHEHHAHPHPEHHKPHHA